MDVILGSLSPLYRELTQLVECVLWEHEVAGSSPAFSTMTDYMRKKFHVHGRLCRCACHANRHVRHIVPCCDQPIADNNGDSKPPFWRDPFKGDENGN